jgi:hypothetical protein
MITATRTAFRDNLIPASATRLLGTDTRKLFGAIICENRKHE